MGISVSQLRDVESVKKIVIHPIDLSLYLVSVVVDKEEHYVTDASGAPLKSHNILELQTLFEQSNIDTSVLERQSTYGEIVSRSVNIGGQLIHKGAMSQLHRHPFYLVTPALEGSKAQT